ncbi:nucleotide-sugar uncharacterized transporter 2 isoform X2 [Solanum pennellii]|uniref:Nucleotide-sugar uncharacterized transporter 2 isoform X2 n=1 Tax=Solanum pennellii TaxID=28526 RepID=A0ABM1FQ09_SOLPN|nr:nucleotide-sugar uncharacterized transporter 2 isoform X2 [Solanum pennellii]
MGLLDYLFGNGGRRFIKRKDSDAGEAGRALEELRGSLYNELRTSEGAKRQQQRFCGPVMAMTFNFMVAVGIILGNKLVMGRVGFKFPIFLTLIHYCCSWILLAIFKALSLLPAAPPARTTPFSSLFSLGVVMAFASGLANASLSHNSVGFYQMAKIAVTPTIVIAEFFLFKKKVSFHKVLALAVVSVGVAVATVTDLEFNFFGACIALAWIVPSGVNKILWSNLQQQTNWTALAFMQVDVEDDSSDNFLLGTTVAFARPSRSAIFQVGHQQYECYSHLSLTRFPLAMVWSFSTWSYISYVTRCFRTIQDLCDPSRRIFPV